MPDDENPPVRRFKLKPKEITHTDTSARPGDGTAISVPLMHRQNEIAAERSSLRKWDDYPQSLADAAAEPGGSPLLAPKEVEATDPRACAGDGTAISVGLIHRQNKIAAGKLGPDIVAMPPKRRSRRTRDFIMLMTIVGSLIALLMMQLPRTTGTLLMGLFCAGWAAALLGWIMFGVMDDY